MCERCQDTGVRPFTEEELDDELESCDPEEARTTCSCECEIGQARQNEFWAKWGPIVAKAVEEA